MSIENTLVQTGMFYNICTWPECKCNIPDYAFSAHNRVHSCEKVKSMKYLLIGRDCIILDGSCNCLKPFEDCKYLTLKEKKNDIITNRDDATKRDDQSVKLDRKP